MTEIKVDDDELDSTTQKKENTHEFLRRRKTYKYLSNLVDVGESPPRIVPFKKSNERLRCKNCNKLCNEKISDEKGWETMFEKIKEHPYYTKEVDKEKGDGEAKIDEKKIMKRTALRIIETIIHEKSKVITEKEVLIKKNTGLLKEEKNVGQDKNKIGDLKNVLFNLSKSLNRDEVYLAYWKKLYSTQKQETADSLIKRLFYQECHIYCDKTCKTNAELTERERRGTGILDSDSDSDSPSSSHYSPLKAHFVMRESLNKTGGKKKRKRKTKKKKTKKHRGKSPKKKKTKKHRRKRTRKRR